MKNKVLTLGILVAILASGCADNQVQVKDKTRYERIVSTSPAATEILFALGLEDEIVSVTTYCDYPPAAKEKPKIGGFSTYSCELIIHSTPDLIIASSIMTDNDIKRFENAGIKVVMLNPKNIDEILENIRLVGNLTGSEKEAEELIRSMKKRMDKVKDDAGKLRKKPKVMYVLWSRPLTSAGKETFANDIIEIAGGENIYLDLNVQYLRVSLESVLEKNPDIIIASVGMGSGGNSNYKAIMNDHRLKNVNAAKNGRIYKIDDDLVSRSGPRIVDALEQFAEWIQE